MVKKNNEEERRQELLRLAREQMQALNQSTEVKPPLQKVVPLQAEEPKEPEVQISLFIPLRLKEHIQLALAPGGKYYGQFRNQRQLICHLLEEDMKGGSRKGE